MKKMWLIFKRIYRNSAQFRGFILIEIIIAMFIFLLLAAVMFTILATGRNAWQIGDARIQLQQELRKGLDGMIEELRQAGSLTIVDVPADGSWYDTITFRIPADVINGNIVWSDEIQYLLGGLDGRQLLRRSGGEERVLANNLISIGFRRQPTSPKIVEIDLGVDKTTIRGTQIDVSLNSQVKLRN